MSGAGDGTRTRDPELGKLVLYQLSYARIQEMPDYFDDVHPAEQHQPLCCMPGLQRQQPGGPPFRRPTPIDTSRQEI